MPGGATTDGCDNVVRTADGTKAVTMDAIQASAIKRTIFFSGCGDWTNAERWFNQMVDLSLRSKIAREDDDENLI